MYAHTNYLSLDIHRETDLFLVVLAFINIFYLSSVIHPDGLYYYLYLYFYTTHVCLSSCCLAVQPAVAHTPAVCTCLGL